MADERRKKTIQYFRAQFLDSRARTLAFYLKSAHDAAPNVEDRTFSIGGEQVKCCHVSQQRSGAHYLHITVSTPGELASTVPQGSGMPQVDLDTTPAPRGSEFMDGDIMMRVQDNHVLFCSTGLHQSRATQYLREVFRSTGQPETALGVSFVRVADMDRLNLVREQGVKSVGLAAGAYPASLSHAERENATVHRKLIGRVWDELKDLWAEDDELKDITESENLTAEVVIRFDRRRKGGELGQKRIESLAEMLLDEGDGFRITTMGGETVTAESITLRKPIKVPKHGKTVNFEAVWGEMRIYMDELKAGGLLEQ